MDVHPNPHGFVEYRVGAPCPPPYDHALLRGRDLARLDQTLAGDWLLLAMINGPDAAERRALHGRIGARYLRQGEPDGAAFVLSLAQFGGRIEFELPFDPCAYPAAEWDERRAGWRRNSLAQMLCVDSATGVLLAARLVSMPVAMRGVWLAAWEGALGAADYHRRYDAWLSALFRRHDTSGLWALAQEAGHWGDK